MPNNKGSVGRNKPTFAETNSSIFIDNGVNRTMNRNNLSK